MSLESYRASIEASGLEFAHIERHHALIAAALERGTRPLFKISDTCRLDNGGLLALARLARSSGERPGEGICAFIPAAGAASRYAAPLADLQAAIETADRAAMRASLDDLAELGAESWPLASGVKRLLQRRADLPDDLADQRDQLLRDLALPKALLPCVREGLSFLRMKDLEHAAIDGLEGQIFVAPPGMRDIFATALARVDDGGAPPSRLPTGYLEQGPRLSTIRFRRDGTPFLDADGSVSVVPAGHGALASLFGDVRQVTPKADSVLIRNIDNVSGTLPAACAATNAFLAAHRRVLNAFYGVRQALARDDRRQAAEIAETLLPSAYSPASWTQILAGVEDPAERRLWEVLFSVVHTPPPARLHRHELVRLYARPVNLLGQVPNTGKDIGGTPCFVATPQGPVKLSIEVPHVSDADKRSFLADPTRATHFNPAFTCAEIPADADYYDRANHDFWLLSEKTYRGERVVYFETVLYELLGNSFLANAVFVEVPRDVFNPHKVLADAAGRSVKDWTPPRTGQPNR